MAAVEVVARNLHRGHIETATKSHPQGGGTKGGDIRPVCDTCGWRGPKYGPGDRPVAEVGLEAHIATADSSGDNWMYQISTRGVTAVWDFEALEWQ